MHLSSSSASHVSGVVESQVIQEKFVTVERCRMRYLTGGEGPALVLIHGLLGYSFSWRSNLEVLARHARIYAPDLPGTGFSSREPPLPGDIDSLARQVLAFLRTLQIREAVLLGSSHGGGIALVAAALARGHNIRVTALILVSPINPWSSQGLFLARVASSVVGAKVCRSMGWCVAPLHGAILRRMYGDPRRVTQQAIEGYSLPIKIAGTMDTLLGRIKDWKAQLQTIGNALPAVRGLPVLLLWGDRDGAVYLSSAQQLLNRLRLAELRVIPTAGHLPYEELPDEFNRLVNEFLIKLPDKTEQREGS